MPPIDFLTLSQIALQTLTLFILIVGLLGLIVPVFPGLVIMWLATLVYALVQAASGLMTGWDWTLFVLISALMVIGSFADNYIIAKKMVNHKIPWRSILISYAAGIIVSLFATPLIGLLASPLTLLGVEYLRLKDRDLAFESARVFLIGWGASFAARFAIGVLMIIFWGLWAFV